MWYWFTVSQKIGARYEHVFTTREVFSVNDADRQQEIIVAAFPAPAFCVERLEKVGAYTGKQVN